LGRAGTPPLSIGVEPGYVREEDVRIQVGLVLPDLPIMATLEGLHSAVMRRIL
jgi:hypothetical protein